MTAKYDLQILLSFHLKKFLISFQYPNYEKILRKLSYKFHLRKKKSINIFQVRHFLYFKKSEIFCDIFFNIKN
jgi:hypothetical protein